MGELSKTLAGIAQKMEMLEAENAALRKQLEVAWPAVRNLYETLQAWHAAPLGVVGMCLPMEVSSGPMEVSSGPVAVSSGLVETQSNKVQRAVQAVETALAKKGKNCSALYTDGQVAEWYKAMVDGASTKEVARQFNVYPATIRTRLTKLGYLCACGVLIGTEEAPAAKGHDGVCGYCRGEKEAVEGEGA